MPRLFNISTDEAINMLDNIYNNLDPKRDGEGDSVSTRFMKALGYEGVDVRHLMEFDNTTYGTVVYDLKGGIDSGETGVSQSEDSQDSTRVPGSAKTGTQAETGRDLGDKEGEPRSRTSKRSHRC